MQCRRSKIKNWDQAALYLAVTLSRDKVSELQAPGSCSSLEKSRWEGSSSWNNNKGDQRAPAGGEELGDQPFLAAHQKSNRGGEEVDLGSLRGARAFGGL